VADYGFGFATDRSVVSLTATRSKPSLDVRTPSLQFDRLLEATGSAILNVSGPLLRRLEPYRLPLVIAIHLTFIVLANYLAFWLRFDGSLPADVAPMLAATLPWIIGVRGLVFAALGLYGGLWRYTGVWDLSRIVAAVLASSLILYVSVYGRVTVGYPRSVVLLDAILLVFLLGGARLMRRVLPSIVRARSRRHVLIVGAGDAGDMIVREMRKTGEYEPVAFVDDDPSKVGRTIHGVRVLGTSADLAHIVETAKPGEVLVAIPTGTPATIRRIVEQLRPFKLPITTLPGLEELVNGKVGVKQIRPLAIEDLLPRSQVRLNAAAVRELISGKRVLVTGAGGSIGSELARQIAALQPAQLILLERYENSLYAVANDLVDRGAGGVIHPVVGDVTDAARVNDVFASYRPHLVFHAAAHKHVPLMETNPCEAVKNNVGGTGVVVQAAVQHKAERFVLISTDKAANPSSVMGASKRVAELVVQAASQTRSDTRCVTVRFGNVLGSNGSVIPRMLDQIRAGGPVTVTHPEIRRYFMLIPEAVQLVMYSAVLALGRETFVLDMGEQLKVLDVAKNLIRLSGFVPEQEIPISYIGLRPGEKLIEELVGDGETLETSGVDKIFKVRPGAALDLDEFNNSLSTLIRFATLGQPRNVIGQLRNIVPTFTPSGPSAAIAPLPPAPVVEKRGAPTTAAAVAAVSAAPEV
jgi:FlaA1/EpsC-like NDP-sugar epimerase